MPFLSRSLLCAAVLLLAAACRPDDGVAPPPEVRQTPTPPDAIILHPERVGPGDAIGDFRVLSLNPHQQTDDLWYGSAELEGTVVLSGEYIDYHPVPVLSDPDSPCFRPDDESARQLPRFPGDERGAWLCFDNADEALRVLGVPTSDGERITVEISRYSYAHVPRDDVNMATLSRVLDAP